MIVLMSGLAPPTNTRRECDPRRALSSLADWFEVLCLERPIPSAIAAWRQAFGGTSGSECRYDLTAEQLHWSTLAARFAAMDHGKDGAA